MAEKRDRPYVWVTWLPHIMLGSRVCQWGVWFKSNYKDFARRPSDFHLAAWTTEHAQRLDTLADTLTAASCGVNQENQNLFHLRRSSGMTVGGKPDLITWSPQGQYTVYDVKTGARSDAHAIQVMLYMALLPFSNRFKGKTFTGSILYSDRGSYVNVPPTAVDDAFRKRIGYFLVILGRPEAPARCPSPAEGRFCDITSADCPERATGEAAGEGEPSLPF
jgi:hypothetical protein